jgi:hypothetical protein
VVKSLTLAEIFTCGMGVIVACCSTTRGAVDKWNLQADSACKTVLDSFFQVVLIIVESCRGGGFRIFVNRRRLWW